MINSVVFSGRLHADPQLKITPSGRTVLNIRLANNRKRNDVTSTTWMAVTLWQGTAELVAKYFKKGDPITVAGRLENNTWKDDEGKTHSQVIIVANEIHFPMGRPAGNTTQDSDGDDTPHIPFEDASDLGESVPV